MRQTANWRLAGKEAGTTEYEFINAHNRSDFDKGLEIHKRYPSTCQPHRL